MPGAKPLSLALLSGLEIHKKDFATRQVEKVESSFQPRFPNIPFESACLLALRYARVPTRNRKKKEKENASHLVRHEKSRSSRRVYVFVQHAVRGGFSSFVASPNRNKTHTTDISEKR